MATDKKCWVYRKVEKVNQRPEFEVGWKDDNDQWILDSIQPTEAKAVGRVHFLNGGLRADMPSTSRPQTRAERLERQKEVEEVVDEQQDERQRDEGIEGRGKRNKAA